MAVQVGLVGLVGLALIGVQGVGFLSLGTAVALAGLAIGILAVGTILTLASLRHTLNVVYDQGNRLDQLAARVGALADELRVGDEAVGWGTEEPTDMDLTANLTAERGRMREDPRERKPEPGPGSPPDPLERGETHALIDVPGLDAESVDRLNEVGITDTQELWSGDPVYMAGSLGVEPQQVERWQTMAELMALEGIDGEDAEMLTRAGIGSVDELRHETPERLMRRVDETESVERVGALDPQQAHDWIEAARNQETQTREASEGPEA